jgi:hypothetical protein
LLTWTTGPEPLLALARPFDEDFNARGDALQLNDNHPIGDKPDIQWDGDRFTVTWDGEQPAVWLRRLDASGRPLGPSTVVPIPQGVANTPDLAVAPGGAGVVVFNAAEIPSLGEGGGMHWLQAFDEDLRLTGPTAVMSISAMTTPDAAIRSDGAVAAVWTEAYDHPQIANERYFEVHGRFYYPDGRARSFRVDDQDAAWPSRPAIAATDTRLAVSWRDKISSEGLPAGAYGRLFDADGLALGPSLPLGPPGHDGDRAVVVLSDDLAVFAWQHTHEGVPESFVRVLDPVTGAPLTEAVLVTPAGGAADERPSLDARFSPGRADLLLTWESRPLGSARSAIWARSLTVTLDPR